MNPRARPFYPHEHSGPVLVCANAWTFRDDYRRAREKFPRAPVIAVNGAAKEVEAFALFSLHPEKFRDLWAPEQTQNFGAGFSTHSGGQSRTDRYADYLWPEAGGKGSSSWSARKMAGLMGFAPVILVGAPLSAGGYAHTTFSQFWHREDRIEFYRDYVARDRDWHDGVHSMSGWTREMFGEP